MPQQPRAAGDAIELSVVIPMFREALRAPATLDRLNDDLASLDRPAEVLLVDDGSDDRTAEAVRPYLHDASRGVVRRTALLSHPANRGKGAAVRMGLAAAAGSWALMMDADGSARAAEAGKLFMAASKTGSGLVIGSRQAEGALVKAYVSRWLSGRIYTAALWALGIRGVRDTQCGFKLYSRAAAGLMVSRGVENGFAFDIEHIGLALRAGLGVAEVGIEWSHRDGGSVRVLRDGPRMLLSAWRIQRRLRAMNGLRAELNRGLVEVKPLTEAVV